MLYCACTRVKKVINRYFLKSNNLVPLLTVPTIEILIRGYATIILFSGKFMMFY